MIILSVEVIPTERPMCERLGGGNIDSRLTASHGNSPVSDEAGPNSERKGDPGVTESTNKKPFLPPRWVIHLAWQIHRSLYRFTNGRLGLRRPKADRYGLMRITTTGRRTGQDRSVMLAYVESGPDLVTLAMNGWGAAEPAWWLNLQAHPDVKVDLVDGPRQVTGQVARGEQRERLWAQWRELDDKLDAFAGLRPSETDVVMLKPRPMPTPG